MPIKYKKLENDMIEMVFDTEEARGILYQCLETTKKESSCDFTADDLSSVYLSLQDAIDDLSESGPTPSQTLKELNKVRNALDSAITFSERIPNLNIQEHIENAKLQLIFKEAQVQQKRLLKHYKSTTTVKNLNADELIYELNQLASSDEKILDTPSKGFTGFMVEFRNQFKERKGYLDFLAIFYRDYYHPKVLKKNDLKKNDLKYIIENHVRSIVRAPESF